MALEAAKDTTCFFPMSFTYVALSQMFFPLIVSEMISEVEVGEDHSKQSLRLQPLRAI